MKKIVFLSATFIAVVLNFCSIEASHFEDLVNGVPFGDQRLPTYIKEDAPHIVKMAVTKPDSDITSGELSEILSQGSTKEIQRVNASVLNYIDFYHESNGSLYFRYIFLKNLSNRIAKVLENSTVEWEFINQIISNYKYSIIYFPESNGDVPDFRNFYESLDEEPLQTLDLEQKRLSGLSEEERNLELTQAIQREEEAAARARILRMREEIINNINYHIDLRPDLDENNIIQTLDIQRRMVWLEHLEEQRQSGINRNQAERRARFRADMAARNRAAELRRAELGDANAPQGAALDPNSDDDAERVEAEESDIEEVEAVLQVLGAHSLRAENFHGITLAAFNRLNEDQKTTLYNYVTGQNDVTEENVREIVGAKSSGFHLINALNNYKSQI